MNVAARGVRILHAALAIGLCVVAGTFVLVLRSLGPSLPNTPLIGYATAGLRDSRAMRFE